MTTPAATEHARWETAYAALGLTPHPAPGDDPSREVDGTEDMWVSESDQERMQRRYDSWIERTYRG